MKPFVVWMPARSFIMSTALLFVLVPQLFADQNSVQGSASEVANVAAVSAESTPEFALLTDVDALWVCLAAFLVFFMQAGFAMVETGFTRA